MEVKDVKKVVYGFGIAVMMGALLTGCGNSSEASKENEKQDNSKVLTCTQNENESGILMDVEQKYIFKDEVMTNINFKVEISLGDELLESMTQEQIDAFYEELEKGDDEFEESEAMKETVKRENDKVIVAIDGDVSKMTADEKESILEYEEGTDEEDGPAVELTYDAYKKALESQGYTCK